MIHGASVDAAPLPYERRWVVERGERLVVGWAMATCLLIGWAAVSLANVSETLFLKRVGVQYLPLVFLANSLCMVMTTASVGRLAARVDHRRLLVRTLLILAFSIMPLWLLVRAEVHSAYVVLVFASKQLEAIALLVLWVALGDLLNARQAKRLYAPIMAGGTLGAIAGSFASGALGRAAGVAAPLPSAAIALALAAGLALGVDAVRPLRVRSGRRATVAPRRVDAPTLRSLWRDSRLFRLLAGGTLLSGVLGPMLYFQFAYVTDLATKGSDGEQRLLALYAAFRGFLNIGVLAIQLLGTTFVFRRIGVPLAATLSPLVYLFGFFGIGVRLDLPAGIGAVTGANLQDHAIFDPAMKVLTTLFREPVRPAVTALIDGPVRRLGGAIGNVVILVALAVGTPMWVGLAGLPIAGVWFVVTVALWRVYPTLLLEATSFWPVRTRDDRPLAELLDRRTVRMLEARLVDGDPEVSGVVCDLVAASPRPLAVATLARAACRAPRAVTPLLVDTLHRVLEAGTDDDGPIPGAVRDLEAVLARPADLDDLTRARILQALADLGGAMVPSRFVDDPAPAVRLVARARVRSADGAAAIEADLVAALHDPDPGLRRIAIGEIRRAARAPGTDAARRSGFGAALAARLANGQDRVGAAEALAEVAMHHPEVGARHADAMLAHAEDVDVGVRAAVIRFVGCLRLLPHVRWVVGRLASADDVESAAAREALQSFGTAAIQPLLAGLAFGGRGVHDAALPILHDMHLEARTLRELVAGEMAAVRTATLQHRAMVDGPVSRLLLLRLGERVDEGLHAILLLLAVLFRENRIAEIGLVLVRSHDRRARAVLSEALEALLPDAERATLVPLLDDVGSPAAVDAAVRALGRPVPSFATALAEALNDHDPLTRLLASAPLAAPDVSGENARVSETVVLSHVDIILHLRGLELFADLATPHLAELARMAREEVYAAGETIVREGEFGDQLYVIVAGEVAITRDGRELAVLRAGEFFGELSLFDGETRSATATTLGVARVVRLGRHDLIHVIEEHPGLAIAVCRTLSRRVRELLERGPGVSR